MGLKEFINSHSELSKHGYILVKQFAAEVGISEATLNNWLKDGKQGTIDLLCYGLAFKKELSHKQNLFVDMAKAVFKD